jgi:hypothetical protein
MGERLQVVLAPGVALLESLLVWQPECRSLPRAIERLEVDVEKIF